MIQIQWTCGSLDEAEKIATALLNKKWVVCANIFPHIESLYMWNGKLQKDKEIKVFFKTEDVYFTRVCEYIVAHASYDIPEISKISIADANPDYLTWMSQNLE